jgi:hypothetical protein
MSLFLCALAALTVLPHAASAQGGRATETERPGQPRALLVAGHRQSVDGGSDPTVLRSRSVGIDRDVVSGIRPSQRLKLDLFDDASVTVIVERSVGPGSWSGRIEGRPGGTFTMVVRDDIVSAVVRAPDLGTFRIRPSGDGHVAQEINAEAYPPCATPAEVGGLPLPAMAGFPNCDDGAEIDVLVLYTPLARDDAGGTAAIEAEIALAVAVSNDAYDNSLIPLQLNLAHVALIDYDESGEYSAHLSQLQQTDDGVMDEAHGLRYQHSADMVALIVEDGAYCGMAYLMMELSPEFEKHAFSVTTWYCAVGGLTFAHELGHNMGCCHAPGDGGGCQDGGLFSYSVGYRYYGDSGTLWRTIMAYAPGNRIDHFSNPDVSYDGDPTGVPVGQPNEAHNALTIDQTRETIANFRCALPYCEATQFTPPDGNPPDSFGNSLDRSGDTVVVGAQLDDESAPYAGSAYVLRLDPEAAQWIEEAKLLASDGEEEDVFGCSVGISGDVIIVGATRDDDLGIDAGAAYAYRYDADAQSWIEEAKLLASDGEAGDRFGASVAISGDVAIVGALLDDDNGADAGSAYVYRYDPGPEEWVQEAKLLASDGGADDRFGASVAISGDVVVVGAPSVFDENLPGSAYVYRYEAGSGTWPQEEKLTPAEGLYDAFGTDVALDGDTAIVGASYDDGSGLAAGAAYIYVHDGSTWQLEQVIRASDANMYDSFGVAVDVRGDYAIVGAAGDNDNGSSSGSAYVFRHDGSEWLETAKLLAPGGAASDLFGSAVAVQGRQALVGATHAAGSGSVYFYQGFSGLDCNGNALLDDCEVLSGEVADLNGNGIPDECEVPGDLDGDGEIGVIDLLILLGAWGPCPPPCEPPVTCLGDLDGDCEVGINDFLTLLGNWG